MLRAFAQELFGPGAWREPSVQAAYVQMFSVTALIAIKIGEVMGLLPSP